MQNNSEIAKEGKGVYKGYDFLIKHAFNTHYCAYVRIPEGHKFYGIPYDDIDIDCHGGLTFGSFTNYFSPLKNSKSGYWIGWDYAHCDDWSCYNKNGKKWTIDEIYAEVKKVIDQL